MIHENLMHECVRLVKQIECTVRIVEIRVSFIVCALFTVAKAEIKIGSILGPIIKIGLIELAVIVDVIPCSSSTFAGSLPLARLSFRNLL